ncbi:MAG: hypothetical protein LBC84_05845 [Prevotellaceae bacterium]|jgi:hypothetical protein|nr:hypothetical protein [Prevotellaceae bacterium]
MKRINLKSIADHLSNMEMKLVTGGDSGSGNHPDGPDMFLPDEPDGYCNGGNDIRCYLLLPHSQCGHGGWCGPIF